MSVYLHQRLAATQTIPDELLDEAFSRALAQRSSLVEALIGMDPGLGQWISQCFSDDGDEADQAWRPDPRLLMALPPGICDQLLAFPFRERAGAVEVASVTPLEEFVQLELQYHLNRPVVLYRASLQGLLAAAGAAVDLQALADTGLPDSRPLEEAPIPLVRRPVERAGERQRTPTRPGMGNLSTRFSRPMQPSMPGTVRGPALARPSLIDIDSIRGARDKRELSKFLASALPAPILLFELRQGHLVLRFATGPGAYGDETVSLVQESAFCRAVEEGSYVGPWYDNPTHARFASSFSQGALVRIERIGAGDSGLLVTMAGEFEIHRAAHLLRAGAQRWVELVESER